MTTDLIAHDLFQFVWCEPGYVAYHMYNCTSWQLTSRGLRGPHRTARCAVRSAVQCGAVQKLAVRCGCGFWFGRCGAVAVHRKEFNCGAVRLRFRSYCVSSALHRMNESYSDFVMIIWNCLLLIYNTFKCFQKTTKYNDVQMEFNGTCWTAVSSCTISAPITSMLCWVPCLLGTYLCESHF